MQVNQNLNKFIPKVLLLGNENEIPNDLPKFEIVGKIEMRQLEPNILQLLFEGQPLSESKLKSLDFDYVLCPNDDLYWRNRLLWGKFFPRGILTTNNFFRYYVSNVGFTTQSNLDSLYKLISKDQTKSPKQILDLDAYLYRSDAFDFPNGYLAAPPPRNYFISKLSSKILLKSSQFGGMFTMRFSQISKKSDCEVMT